jgi:hypothetical protein
MELLTPKYLRVQGEIKMKLGKVNRKEFNSKIYNKGKFSELIVSPYSGEKGSMYNRVLVISDKVTAPTYFTHNREKLALVLPYSGNIKQSVINNIHLIAEWTRVQATFFTIMDMSYKRLFTVNAS